MTKTVTGIKAAAHTTVQPLLCCVGEAVAVMTGLAVQVMLLTDTTEEALQLLSHTVSSLSDSCLGILEGILLLLAISL